MIEQCKFLSLLEFYYGIYRREQVWHQGMKYTISRINANVLSLSSKYHWCRIYSFVYTMVSWKGYVNFGNTVIRYHYQQYSYKMSVALERSPPMVNFKLNILVVYTRNIKVKLQKKRLNICFNEQRTLTPIIFTV